MIRGTTPTLVFKFPFEVSVIDKLWLIFSQNGEERLFLDDNRCSLREDTATFTLTQEETLQLIGDNLVSIQIRILSKNKGALASKIITRPVYDVLRGGVI